MRDRVIQNAGKLDQSANDHDWLGHGIYFWEHGPKRALKWAEQQKKRGKLRKPAVIGAVLHLGTCFDLLDTAYTDVLTSSYPEFCASLKAAGKSIPRNEPLNRRDAEDKARA